MLLHYLKFWHAINNNIIKVNDNYNESDNNNFNNNNNNSNDKNINLDHRCHPPCRQEDKYKFCNKEGRIILRIVMKRKM